MPGMRRFFQKAVRWAAAGALATGLLACSPTYDWRIVQSEAGGYSVMYPAKPSADTRQIVLNGMTLPMTMQAAHVDKALFAVGVVTLPRDDAALRDTVLASLQHGLLANLGGARPQTRPVTVTLASDAAHPVSGVAIAAHGVAAQDKTERYVNARFVAYGTHVYQIVVLAQKAPPPDQVEQFLTSLTLN